MSDLAIFKRAASLTLPVVFFLAGAAGAQELVPGAYTPAPVGFNLITTSGSFSTGALSFDPTLPVENAHAKLGVGTVGYGRTLRVAGRFANVIFVLPYVYGHAQGIFLGQQAERWLNGIGDPVVRVGINLVGAPAMTPKEYAAYRPGVLVGLSLTMSLPLGEYEADRFINIGRNRWAFKPEIGISSTHGKWTVEGDFSTGFFTDNTNYVNGHTLAQAPIASVQGHLIYTIRRGYWIAGDANYFYGGRLTNNGVEAASKISNSRIGVTVAVPIPFINRQIRIAYSDGLRTALGGDFRTIGVSYSHAWK